MDQVLESIDFNQYAFSSLEALTRKYYGDEVRVQDLRASQAAELINTVVFGSAQGDYSKTLQDKEASKMKPVEHHQETEDIYKANLDVITDRLANRESDGAFILNLMPDIVFSRIPGARRVARGLNIKPIMTILFTNYATGPSPKLAK